MSVTAVDIDAIKAEIHSAIVNQKGNFAPLVLRLAWHGSGTYSVHDRTGGLNGATMRFSPEINDGANAGLHIAISLMNAIKVRHPELSHADLWALGGVTALEIMGGPKVNVTLGRSDATSGAQCPVVGRLPDASQGAAHIRDIFYRMGFNDQEIVALVGAHTLGSCHRTRSGFEGFWTRNPYKFDNGFFKNLLHMEWIPRKWDGPLQYTDADTEELMMLPSDIALRDDPEFRKWAEVYAKDEGKFFEDFGRAFAKLISLGLPENLHATYQEPGAPAPRQAFADATARDVAKFLEFCNEGHLDGAKSMLEAKTVCSHVREPSSARTGLHKAAFGNHLNIVNLLIESAGQQAARTLVNAQDFEGETALFDAARAGNKDVAIALLRAGADRTVRNRQGKQAYDVAVEAGHQELVELLGQRQKL